MDYDEVNKELDIVRNNGSDYVKAMNDAEWSRILKQMVDNGDLPEWPEDSVESILDKTRLIYHDYGVTPPASPVAPQGPSIFVTPWVYHEILTVLAEIDAIERKEQAKNTRWARLRKIDKIRRELHQNHEQIKKYESPLGVPISQWALNPPYLRYQTWIS